MDGNVLVMSLRSNGVEMIDQHDRIILPNVNHVDLNGLSFLNLDSVRLVADLDDNDDIYGIEMVSEIAGHLQCNFFDLEDVHDIFLYGKKGEIYNNVY